MRFSLISVAHHKHPTYVILSCLSLYAKFVPKRTIDIQYQSAHIKGEYYKSSNIHCLSIVRLKCVVINHQKGEIEEYLGPLSGFWWFNDTHLSS
jgi:hypothetical protein